MLNKTISDILKLNVTQIKLLILLFTCDLFRRIASLMLETASSSVFLFEFSGEYLPIVFMCTAILMAIGALHFIKIKNMPAIAATVTLMGMAAVTLLLYLIYVGRYTEFASMALMVWKNVCFLLSEITFLLVALKFCKYDWRDWRFIALLLTEAIAMIVSGLAVTVLVFFITPQSIIAISSLLLFVSGLFLLPVSKYLDTKKIVVKKAKIKSTTPIVKQKRLVSAFFITMALFIFGGYIVEYGFYKSVYALYGEEWLSDMTAFFAMYHVFAGLLVVLVIFMFYKFESLEGLRMTVVTLPLFIFVGAAGAITASVSILSFSRMGKDIMYRLVMTPTAKFFSVPLLPELRKHLSSIRRIWIEPVSIFCAGILLYHLESDMNFELLASILLVTAMAITLMAYATYSLYNDVAKDSLEKHSWKNGKLFLESKKIKKFIENKLLSLDVYDTIYYLRVLDEAYGMSSRGYNIYALNHPSEKVRLFALLQLENAKEKMAMPAIWKLIEEDKSKNVRCMALQVYCVIGGREVYKDVEPFLDTELMEGAASGLIKSSPEGAFIAAMKMANLMNSKNGQDKVTAARIIGRAVGSEYDLPLKKLMYDEDKEVQIAALSAAANLGSPVFAEDFIIFLHNPYLKEYATEGLIKIGENALPFLEKAFISSDNKIILPKLIGITGTIGGNEAQTILLDNLKRVSAYMRLMILQTMDSKNYKLTFLASDTLMSAWHFEVNRKAWLEASLRDVSKSVNSEGCDSLHILVEALNNELQQSVRIIELLKNFLDYKNDITIPLQFSITHKDNIFNLDEMNLSDRLKDIIVDGDNLHKWTKAAAIYCAGCLNEHDLTEVIQEAAQTDKALIKETARWSLNQIAGKHGNNSVQDLNNKKEV